jgi:hypothetical protein
MPGGDGEPAGERGRRVRAAARWNKSPPCLDEKHRPPHVLMITDRPGGLLLVEVESPEGDHGREEGADPDDEENREVRETDAPSDLIIADRPEEE